MKAFSKIALGTWQATGWNKSNPAEFLKIVQTALDLEIELFDTAESYGKGESEVLLAKALGEKRKNVQIATKFTHLNATKQKLRNSLEASLKRLNTDYIDIYQYHWPSPEIPLDETIDELIQLKKEGKIRRIGVSNWNTPEWNECSLTEHIDIVQNCYSLLWRKPERFVLPHAHKNKINFLAYSPLCQGILAGYLKSQSETKSDPRNKNRWLKPTRQELIQPLMSYLKELSAELNATPAQIALQWVLTQKGVNSCVVGASSPAQLQQSLEAITLSIPQDALSKLDQISKPLSKDIQEYETLWNWHPRAKKNKIEMINRKVIKDPDNYTWKNPYIDKTSEHEGVLYPFLKSIEFSENEQISFSKTIQNTKKIYLEFGSGSGGHLIDLAQANPDTLCIGFEIRYKRIVRTAEKAKEKGIKNIMLLRARAEHFPKYFQERKIDNVYVNFPDPWSKKKWKKHRLLSDEFLQSISKSLVNSGAFLYKTDHREYFEATLKLLQQASYFDLTAHSFDLYNSEYLSGNIKTEFEKLFLSKEQPIHYLRAISSQKVSFA